MATCKVCGSELPKKAKSCPQCGVKVYQPPKNIRVLAIVGAVLAIIGGLLPFVQNSDIKVKAKDCFSFMSYLNNDKYEFTYHQYLWYFFMLALVATCIIVAAKKEIYSIITTVIAVVIYGITMKDLSTFMADPQYVLGVGTYVVVIGLIVAIAGCFLDILKFKKTIEYDTRYMKNHKPFASRVYVHRWFYLMMVPVLIFVLLLCSNVH